MAKATLADVFRAFNLGDVGRIQRTRAGRHQRAAGAWSWWSLTTGRIGSQWSVREVVRAFEERRLDIYYQRPTGDVHLIVESSPVCLCSLGGARHDNPDCPYFDPNEPHICGDDATASTRRRPCNCKEATRMNAHPLWQARRVMTDDERREIMEDTFDDWCLICGGVAGCYCAPAYDE